MPTVQCPYCLQKIEAPLEQLADEVYCQACATWFAPLDDAPAEQDGTWDAEPEYTEPAYAEPLFLPAAEPEAPEPPADAWPGPAAAVSGPDAPRAAPTHCIRCGGRLHNVIDCPRCGASVCSELCAQKHMLTCLPEPEPVPRGAGCSPQALLVAGVLLAVLLACGGIVEFAGIGDSKPKPKPQPAARAADVDDFTAALRAAEADANKAAAGVMLWAVGATVVYLAFSVAFCLWVFKDAKARGLDGALWVLIVFVGGLVGLLLYLVVRGQPRRSCD
jgi:hypothetical protein